MSGNTNHPFKARIETVSPDLTVRIEREVFVIVTRVRGVGINGSMWIDTEVDLNEIQAASLRNKLSTWVNAKRQRDKVASSASDVHAQKG